MKATLIGAIAGSALVLSACGGGTPAEVVRPDAPTATEAMQEAPPPPCDGAPKAVEPLVVDWKSAERAELEVAMKQGVAVMAYSCDGLRLLRDCKLSGSYDFAGVTLKEDVIRIESRNELWANLPLSVGKLDGALEGSSTIDLAVALVGRRGTVRSEAAKTELTGKCDGATHFVRAAHVGAFAMARGEKGRARAAAELFGAGAGGESASEKSVQNRDGDVKACRSATPDASDPPGQCGATVRLLLEPLVAARDPEAAGSAPKSEPPPLDPCPEGWTLSAGKCVPGSSADGPHLCKRDDEADCRAQCDAGQSESCHRLAGLVKDAGKREALEQKACEAGVARACSALAWMKLGKAPKDGLALLDRACALGDAYTCWNTGQWYLTGRGNVPRDASKAALMIERGCSLGYPHACATYGDLLINGEAVKQDVARGLSYYQRLCDNGQPYFCQQLGSMYATDRTALRDIRMPAPKSVKRDAAKGVRVWEQGCALGSLWSCSLAGRHYLKGDGVKKDATRAKQLFERACGDKSKNRDGCEALGSMYASGTGVTKDMAKAVDYWLKSCPSESCTRAAKLLGTGKEGVAKDEARARSVYEAQCKKGAWGTSEMALCLDYGTLLEASDAHAAKDFYADHCSRMGTEMVGGTRVSAHETRGGRMELARTCKRLEKLDRARLVEVMKEACADRGTLCKELEKRDRKAAGEVQAQRCRSKKLGCDDAKRLGAM